MSLCAFWAFIVAAAILYVAPVAGLKLHLAAGQSECVSLVVSEYQLQVSGYEGAVVSFRGSVQAANVAITLNVPHKGSPWHRSRVSNEFDGMVDVTSHGTYQLCFVSAGHVQPPTVDLAHFMLSHRAQAEIAVPKGSELERSQRYAQKEHLQQVREGLSRVSEVAELLRDEQQYMHHRLNRHHETVVSTNQRNTYYTLLEMAALVGVSLLQVFIIRHLFTAQESRTRVNV